MATKAEILAYTLATRVRFAVASDTNEFIVIPPGGSGASAVCLPFTVDGKIPAALLPTLALTSTVTVADQAARLLLSLEQAEGKVVVEGDTGKSFGLIDGGDPSDNGDWIQLGDRNITPADINFGNGAYLQAGDPAYGSGAGGGIEQVCAVDYRLRWEAGREWYYDDGGTGVRLVAMNFGSPGATDDETNRFRIGSLWEHEDKRLWVCQDASEGAAVWEELVTATAANLRALIASLYLAPLVVTGSTVEIDTAVYKNACITPDGNVIITLANLALGTSGVIDIIGTGIDTLSVASGYVDPDGAQLADFVTLTSVDLFRLTWSYSSADVLLWYGKIFTGVLV